MKKTIAMLSLVSMCMSSHAGINVDISNNGVYLADQSTGLLDSPTIGWIQFIYTTSATALFDATIGGGVKSGDIILSQFALTNPGNSDAYGSIVFNLTGAQTTGFWYARLFAGGSDSDGLGATADNIIAGTLYYQSQVYAVIDNTDPTAPNPQNISGNNPVVGDPFNADFVNGTVVPEPSVLAFLGLGGLALAARRRLLVK